MRERGLVKTENYHARTHIFTQTDTSVVVLSRQILCYFFPMFAYLHFLISNNDCTTWAYWKKKKRKENNEMHSLKLKNKNKTKRESHNLGALICFSKCKELSCRAWWVSLLTLCIPVILFLQSDDGGILMPFVLCLFHTGAGAALWWVLLTRTPSTLLTSGSCSRRLSTPPGFSPAATLAVGLPLNFPMTYYSWTVTLFFF